MEQKDAKQEEFKQEDFTKVDQELEDILENEVKYDSDGVARGQSPGRPPSASGSVSSSGSGSKGKRRTWKKPKDKPKRPLSAYNIFFKHERSRIVEGRPEMASPEETIRSIENILSTSRETRRHRKTHGRISFGDLARKIAEKWKAILPEQKAVFEHYAEIDMRRYRKEVKLWKDKKEAEALSGKPGAAAPDNMNNSFSSVESESEFSLDHLNQSPNGPWAPRRSVYDSMSSSCSSVCSIDSEVGLEPIPIGTMMTHSRPNMHTSMPNFGGGTSTIDGGIPGFVQGEFQAQTTNFQMDQPTMSQFGLPLSNMHFTQNQGTQMDSSNGNSNGNVPQQLNVPQQVASSSGGSMNPMDVQQLQRQNNLQHQQLQQQQQILMRQQQLLQLQMQQQGTPNQMQQQMQQQMQMQLQMQMQMQMQQRPMDPIPFQDFPGDGNDLENYLENLDLSNM
jgi:hypothetical protein